MTWSDLHRMEDNSQTLVKTEEMLLGWIAAFSTSKPPSVYGTHGAWSSPKIGGHILYLPPDKCGQQPKVSDQALLTHRIRQSRALKNQEGKQLTDLRRMRPKM